MKKNSLEQGIYNTPAGKILVQADDALREIRFIEEKHSFENSFSNNPVLTNFSHWLENYLSGLKPEFSQFQNSLILEGTLFQKLVWDELIKIPYGKTTTYGAIAKSVGEKLGKEKMSAQAVGNAVGKNPFPILIPCHRVLGKNGELVGYSGGLEKKIALLKLEGYEFK